MGAPDAQLVVPHIHPGYLHRRDAQGMHFAEQPARLPEARNLRRGCPEKSKLELQWERIVPLDVLRLPEGAEPLQLEHSGKIRQ